MRSLVFDSETTGLPPKNKLLNPDTIHSWPYAVQLSFAIYNSTTNVLEMSSDSIIKLPEGAIINEESIQFHGITNEISQSKGIPINTALKNFFHHLRNADKLIGHNVSFDIDIVKVELLRIIYADQNVSNIAKSEAKLNFHYLTNYKNIACTLKDSIELCDIKAIDRYGKTYKKWPKLLELHQKLFETTPNNLHNSFNDILVTLRCYAKMNYGMDLNVECESFKIISQTIQLF